ncbi:MAG: uracil phosphoribosyltransferase [Myxococcota bacterium]
MNDIQYELLPTPGNGLSHSYGPNVHLLSYPYLMSILARLCSSECVQPEVNSLVSTLYDALLGEVASTLLKRSIVDLPTRMEPMHPSGRYIGECIDRDQNVVVVDIARAGILPSHRFHEGLHKVVNPSGIRQDHVVASRTTDASGQVTGVALTGSKIGGTVDDATVLFPDPMAATGSSIAGVIEHYKRAVPGTARAMAAIHLITTPEYLRRITTQFPNLHVFAIRLDRGLSTPEVLRTVPGTQWELETGLNEQQYIIPGAGGVGEVMNNSWI